MGKGGDPLEDRSSSQVSRQCSFLDDYLCSRLRVALKHPDACCSLKEARSPRAIDAFQGLGFNDNMPSVPNATERCANEAGVVFAPSKQSYSKGEKKTSIVGPWEMHRLPWRASRALDKTKRRDVSGDFVASKVVFCIIHGGVRISF